MPAASADLFRYLVEQVRSPDAPDDPVREADRLLSTDAAVGQHDVA